MEAKEAITKKRLLVVVVGDPHVMDAASSEEGRHVSATARRQTSGTHPLHKQWDLLADLINEDRATWFMIFLFQCSTRSLVNNE